MSVWRYIVIGTWIAAVLILLGALIICCETPTPHFTHEKGRPHAL